MGEFIIIELIVEEIEPNIERKKIVLHLSLNETMGVGKVNAEGVKWCGGWDLNPRRPTPSGPQPDPFDQARAPPRSLHSPLYYVLGFIRIIVPHWW